MKIRTGFITNSSSNMYLVRNKSDEPLTLSDFIRTYGVEDYRPVEMGTSTYYSEEDVHEDLREDISEIKESLDDFSQVDADTPEYSTVNRLNEIIDSLEMDLVFENRLNPEVIDADMSYFRSLVARINDDLSAGNRQRAQDTVRLLQAETFSRYAHSEYNRIGNYEPFFEMEIASLREESNLI